jgi:hypothetical protein
MELLTLFILLIFLVLIIFVIVDLIHDTKTHQNLKLNRGKESLKNLEKVSDKEFLTTVSEGLFNSNSPRN